MVSYLNTTQRQQLRTLLYTKMTQMLIILKTKKQLIFLWSLVLTKVFDCIFDVFDVLFLLPFTSCQISYFSPWNHWYVFAHTDKHRHGHLWDDALLFLHLQSSSVLLVNMDVCLHFCEQVHFSFLSPKWMIISVNFIFTECKHWRGLMNFECVHFST